MCALQWEEINAYAYAYAYAASGGGQDRPSRDQRRGPGQEHLHQGPAGRVRPVPGQPGDEEGVPGGDSGAGLCRPLGERRVGAGA